MSRRPLTHSFLFAALALGGCGDDGAIGAGGGSTSTTTTTTSVVSTTTGGGCGPAPGRPSTDACKACTAQHCCAEGLACDADPACQAIASCMETCGDDDACWAESCYPMAMGVPVPLELELELCQLKSCETECKPGPPCTAVDLQDAACEACVEAQCCNDLQAAYGVDLLELQLCQLACLDFACLKACDETHASVIPRIEDLWACFQTPACDGPCKSDDVCGLIGFVDGCSDCVAASSSCGLFEACSLDFDCVQYFQCEIQCQTQEACLQCASLWPAAAAGLELAARNGLENQCQSECGVPMPTCGVIDRLDGADCEACQRQSCCAEGTACGIDPSCMALKVCVAVCAGDAACRTDCEAEFPGALTLYGDLDTCKATSCAADCP